MASKYSRALVIPDTFPDILKKFTREVLREQDNIKNESQIFKFGVKYFKHLLDTRGGSMATSRDGLGSMKDEEIKKYVEDLFTSSDVESNGYLDFAEFHKVLKKMTAHLKLSKTEIRRIMAEADESENGIIEYSEFVTTAVPIIQSLKAKREHQLQEQPSGNNAEHENRKILSHGLLKEEFDDLLSQIFHRCDENKNNYLNRSDFMRCIKDSDLGLTRKEINILMHEAVCNDDGRISYSEFIPVCFEILVHVFAMDFIEVPSSKEEVVRFFLQIFQAEDKRNTGSLRLSTLKQLLLSADVGLTRIQVTALLSEAIENTKGLVDFKAFANKVADMVLSMFTHEYQHEKAVRVQEHRDREEYHIIHGMNRYELESALASAFEGVDTNQQGILPKNEISDVVQTILPNISKRHKRAVLSLADTDADADDLASYVPLIHYTFQTLQWLEEHGATS